MWFFSSYDKHTGPRFRFVFDVFICVKHKRDSRALSAISQNSSAFCYTIAMFNIVPLYLN